MPSLAFLGKAGACLLTKARASGLDAWRFLSLTGERTLGGHSPVKPLALAFVKLGYLAPLRATYTLHGAPMPVPEARKRTIICHPLS